MAITYFEISYPNFVLGAIIDPEEANQNNHEIVDKVNDIIEANNINEINITNLGTVKADKVYVDERDANLAGAGRTTETIKDNADKLLVHKTSSDHDARYYTETEIDSKLLIINNKNTSQDQSLATHKISNDHDTRYHTRDELSAFLRGGDTSIKREVFTIVNADNLDSTFTYVDGDGIEHIGMLLENGEQVYRLQKGFYQIGLERIEVMINDTLNRTSTSGGLMEISETEFALTSPEMNGAEITVKYYEKIGLAGVSIIHYGSVVPDGYAMWYKVV